MQRALFAVSRTSLFSHYGGRFVGSGVPVSVKVHELPSGVATRGKNMATKAGEQVEEAAGEDPKVDASSMDEEHESQMHPHTRKAYRDDMEEAYGVGYATRASEMGYGERYGEAAKAFKKKRDAKNTKEMQRGATAERDEHADAFVDVEYDTTQGEPVAEKEVGRGTLAEHAFESERTVHKDHPDHPVHEEETVKIVSEQIIHREKTVQ